MIGPEDALYTYEYSNHYKILPSINKWDTDPDRIEMALKLIRLYIFF